MERYNDLQFYPVQRTLSVLLKDRSTGKSIIWATDPPGELAFKYTDRQPITVEQLQSTGFEAVQPRMMKESEAQQERTKKKGEVFTPAWICCLMNNQLDEIWFRRKRRLPCKVTGQSWENLQGPIFFQKGRKWQTYVDSRRLEICCGEAPFLVSRYDSATGESLPIERRIGILDRKLRVINENAADEKEWLKWAKRAVQSTYGYEYQGDNLLLARINVLLTFTEYYEARWERVPKDKDIEETAEIISWNLWQMDGLKKTVPYGKPYENEVQMSVLGMFWEEEETATPCIIRDWLSQRKHQFAKLREGTHPMKFDFIIGNPPYQEEQKSRNADGSLKNYAPPVYNYFMDECYKIADRVELIHPARFLFNAGSTPKAWNEKMLNDEHVKVLYYEEDGQKIFPALSVPLRGGVAVTYRDIGQNYGAIQAFTKYPEVNAILRKVTHSPGFKPLTDIIYSRTSYRFTDLMHSENPYAISRVSEGHAYDVSSNIFGLIPEIFLDKKPDDGKKYIRLLGRENNKRTYKFVRRDYIKEVDNLDSYKVYVAQANGSGEFGETISEPMIETPETGATETFLSIGNFKTEIEARNVSKYIKTKLARTLLSVLKVTQNGNKPVWRMIPLQNFTSSSDIDWTKSIPEIDQQLYKKYGLTEKEIDFIETHVKEME